MAVLVLASVIGIGATSKGCRQFEVASLIVSAVCTVAIAGSSFLLAMAPSGDHFEGFYHYLVFAATVVISGFVLFALSIAGFVVAGQTSCPSSDGSHVVATAVISLLSSLANLCHTIWIA